MLKKLITRPSPEISQGAICIAEANSEIIPFEIRRVYYSYGAAAGTIRGHHAHKKLQQILICSYGKIEVQLDNGKGSVQKEILDAPDKGLYVGPSMWRTIKWLEDDSVLLVLASEHYDESDYIRDYSGFKNWINRVEG